jgi:cytochrome c oxidase assembly protein subunit 11
MKRENTRRDLIVAGGFGVLAAAMVGAAYAAVPFYTWFCRTTGFGGTTQVSEKAPGFMLDRTVQVRFDSNIAPGLPWKFTPEKNEITVHIGEVVTALYKVTNLAARPTTAQAPITSRRRPLAATSTRSIVSASPSSIWRRARPARWRLYSMSIRRS